MRIKKFLESKLCGALLLVMWVFTIISSVVKSKDPIFCLNFVMLGVIVGLQIGDLILHRPTKKGESE